MTPATTILKEVGMEPILHYCCRDRNLIGMQSDLLGGYAAGLANFLIITGDPPKVGDYPQATGVFVPREILDHMARCRTKEESRRAGIDIARRTIERVSPRVSGFQVSAPLGSVETALAVLGKER